MPIITDMSYQLLDDGIINVTMTPPVPIGGWSINYAVTKRFGGESGIIQKSVSSGYNGMSGITITNSGAGVFNIAIASQDTSGLNQGAYATTVKRVDSGFVTALLTGYLLLMPD